VSPLAARESYASSTYKLPVPLVADRLDRAGLGRPSLALRSNATVATITLTTSTAVVVVASAKSHSSWASYRLCEGIKSKSAVDGAGERSGLRAAHPFPVVGTLLHAAFRYRPNHRLYQKIVCLFPYPRAV